MSTTVELPVAVRFARDGLVVDISNTRLSIPMFDCQFWSDYTEENERFFIGSLHDFKFETIRPMMSGENYDVFVHVIGILMFMIGGFVYDISPIDDGDFDCLSDLISDYVNETHSNFIPFYVHRLFANIMQNVKKIRLNMPLMELHDEASKYKEYGFRELKPLFFVDGMVNFSKIFKIFNRDLQQIVIFYDDGEFNNSIHLDNMFLEQVLCGILEINENIALKSVFKEILIVNPFDSIDDFIDENQEIFVCNGWNLGKTSYQDKRRDARSDNVLSITPS